MITSTSAVARVLNECSRDARNPMEHEKWVADLLNLLISADAVPRLSDTDTRVAEELFNELIWCCPEAQELAALGDCRPGDSFDPIALGM